MPISETPILSMLRTRMQWHQERQKLLSENVANADTPGFRERDLVPLNLGDLNAARGTGLTLTDARHLGGGIAGSPFGASADRSYAARSTGNAVNLEDQMLKVSANAMDYQAAASLYSRSLGLIKTALGKR